MYSKFTFYKLFIILRQQNMTIDLAILHLNHIEYIISLLHYRKENFRSTRYAFYLWKQNLSDIILSFIPHD